MAFASSSEPSDPGSSPPAAATRIPPQIRPDSSPGTIAPPIVAATLRGPVKSPAQPATIGLDRRQSRRLVRGRTSIDARIDLHGMRQAEALAALRGFITGSHQAGHRYLLVITGKGAPRLSASEPQILSEKRDHGVLRRLVPEWLSEDPAISHAVQGFTTASPRHGGSGALYVTLRSKSRKFRGK